MSNFFLLFKKSAKRKNRHSILHSLRNFRRLILSHIEYCLEYWRHKCENGWTIHVPPLKKKCFHVLIDMIEKVVELCIVGLRHDLNGTLRAYFSRYDNTSCIIDCHYWTNDHSQILLLKRVMKKRLTFMISWQPKDIKAEM